ncbi:GNAT family N-acetyltransferase [Actinomadura sp. LOL_016]|uniref:GNAT family N-acetyltransferase n=1 Tax=unclassified Actinomadura TaxID=2626254 RepID=UPI003A7FCB20
MTTSTDLQTRAFLILPDARLRQTFLDAMAEHERVDGRPDADGLTMTDLRTADGLDCYADGLRTGTAMRPGTEPMRPSVWWYVTDTPEGRTYLGRASIRHQPVVNVLGEAGSQIWVTVRPSMRRQGLGRDMLQAILPFANAHGISEAMIELAAENEAARALLAFTDARVGRHARQFVLATG